MILTDANDAAIALKQMTQDETCPALTDPEFDDLLDKYKRGALWQASTAFNIGDRIIPTLANRNGHRYVAIAYVAAATDQKTGATEPTWNASTAAQHTDGNVIWREDGWDWDAMLWDLRGAAGQAWLLKAAKASVTSDTRVGDLNISSSQLFDHCVAMARQYQRNYIA